MAQEVMVAEWNAGAMAERLSAFRDATGLTIRNQLLDALEEALDQAEALADPWLLQSRVCTLVRHWQKVRAGTA